jgi:hypothetical protein
MGSTLALYQFVLSETFKYIGDLLRKNWRKKWNYLAGVRKSLSAR